MRYQVAHLQREACLLQYSALKTYRHQRIASQRHKIVVEPGLLSPKQLAPERGQQLLRLRNWRHILYSGGAEFRLRKRPTVDFAARIERHGLYLHKDCGYHVRWKKVREPRRNRGGVYVPV